MVHSPKPLTWRMANGQETTSNQQAEVELQHGNRVEMKRRSVFIVISENT